MSASDGKADSPRRDPGGVRVKAPAARSSNLTSLAGLYSDPGVRNYLFTGLAAVAMVFVVMFQRGSDLGGILLVILGGAGMVLRWRAAPLLFLLVLFWFLIFPFGFPDPDINPYEIVEGRFRLEDLILVASVVIYLICHYRLYGLTAQAIPFEQRFPRKDDRPPRRPASLIAPGEIARALYLAGGAVLGGQLLWLLATTVEADLPSPLLFKFRDRWNMPMRPGQSQLDVDFGLFRVELTPLVVLIGIFFFGTMLARLGIGYWKLRQMSPAEGRMILQDASWDETRRERARVENWRAWGRKKTQERAEQSPATASGQGAMR